MLLTASAESFFLRRMFVPSSGMPHGSHNMPFFVAFGDE